MPTHSDARRGEEGDQERQSVEDALCRGEERCGSREESPSSSNDDIYQGYDVEGLKQRIEDEFEKDLQQFRSEEEFADLGGHILGQHTLSDPQQMIDIAATSELVAQVSREEQSNEGGHVIPQEEEEREEERGQEVTGKKNEGGVKDGGKRKNGDEVEEGEVSDSSSDLELAEGTKVSGWLSCQCL